MRDNSGTVLRPRMPELDTLRGVAVLLVLFFHAFHLSAYHATALPWANWIFAATSMGWAGVNLFFVLSGFLITGILLDTRFEPGYYRRFYTRRALRILPAYYAILIFLGIMTRTGLVDRQASWSFLGLSFVYLANVTELFGVHSQYTVLWSLAVEEHFYLAWPAVVRRFSRRALVWTLVAIILLCPALRVFCYLRQCNYGAGYTWLVADGLACGALLAIVARGRVNTPRKMGRLSIALILAASVLFAAGWPWGIYLSRTLAGGALRLTGLNILFAGVLAGALALGSSHFARLVDIPVLRFFGQISYGLYLVHMLVFDAVDHFSNKLFRGLFLDHSSLLPLATRIVIGSSLSIAIAFLSRWYFEEHFLRFQDQASRWNREPIRLPHAGAVEAAS